MKLWDKKIVELLDPILPTYSELTDEPVSIPCITYRLISDIRQEEGDDIRYSLPMYQIRVYIKDLEDAEYYLTKIDETLYENRIFREGFNQLIINNTHQYVMTYSIHTVERIE